MNKREIGLLKKFIKKELPETWDLFDSESEIDRTLDYQEAKNELARKIANFKSNADKTTRSDIKALEGQTQEMQEQLLRNIERDASYEFEKSISVILTQDSKVLQEYFKIPSNYARMVARKNATGMILIGKTGIGKTNCLLKTFKSEGITFVFSNSYSTPLALYEFLWLHRDEHIIIDDCYNLFQNEISKSILKSFWFSTTGTRIVHYNSTTSKKTAPNSFIATGTLSVIFNKLPRMDADLEALKERVLFYEFRLENSDILKIMAEIVKKDYKKLSLEERKEVFEFIKEKCNNATKNLNLRLLFKGYECLLYSKELWKELLEQMIENDEEMIEVLEYEKRYGKEAFLNWKKMREEKGLPSSRATYFRIKSIKIS